MLSLLNKLMSRHLQALKPYESARRLFSGGQDWLNANESPFENEYELSGEALNRYPACQPENLLTRYADYAGVKPCQTLVSRGADEGIELLIRTFCTPDNSQILICPPTYGMYAISAQTNNVGVHEVPLKEDFSLDTDAILAQKGQVNLVFICAPNNPTGTLPSKQSIELVLDAYAESALVVVDEAYIEFASEFSVVDLLSSYENLVVLRTLSKAFALAGIRCGFTLANEDVIQAMLKVIAPYPVAQPVAQIAEQALSNKGIKLMQSQVNTLLAEQKLLVEALDEISQVQRLGDLYANFALVRCQDKQGMMDYLVANGMLIRDQSKQRNLQDTLRISIGSPSQNDRLVKLIQKFYLRQE